MVRVPDLQTLARLPLRSFCKSGAKKRDFCRQTLNDEAPATRGELVVFEFAALINVGGLLW